MPLSPDGCPLLLVELERATRAHPLEPKLLVCGKPAQGRELLRSLGAAGVAWAGWEVGTPRQIAHDLVAAELAREGLHLADEFDVLALLDEAIDAVVERGDAQGLGGAGGIAGFRDSIRQSVEALRAAGLAPADLAPMGETPKARVLGAVLGEYAARLRAAGKLDTAGVLARAAEAVEAGRARLPEGRLYLLPGLSLRGAAGRFAGLLLAHPLAEPLQTDSALGLPAPAPGHWSAPEEATGPLSALHDPPAAPARPALELFAAATPADELREVLRRVLEREIPWDRVEIVATDPRTYGAALDALSRRLGVPASYAAGLDSRRTRVGRAVDAYLRWIGEGFPADLLRALLEAGDLAPRDEASVSGPALARRLRRLRVGWGRERYLPAVERALAAPHLRRPEGDAEDDRAVRERERAELEALRGLLSPILAAAPPLPDRGREVALRVSPAAVADGLLAFLEHVPAGEGEVERTYRSIFRQRLQRASATLLRPTHWEAALGILRARLETRVAPGDAEGLVPWTSSAGRLHLSDLATGGLSCRPHTFVVGLDAARVGGGGRIDPLLTDADRQRLNRARGADALPTAAERAAEARHELAAALARLRGEITLSHSAWDGTEGRSISPAPELLQALRLREGRVGLTYGDLREALGPLACAVPRGAGWVDGGDVWLGLLADGHGLRRGDEAVRAFYGGLARGSAAREARSSGRLTAHDGALGPRPELHPGRNPDQVLSATRLETLGTCPRRYFYRYLLGVRPTRDPEWDADAWLDALERGSLLHSVYEHSLREAREEGVDYTDPAFAALALRVLEREAERVAQRTPPPGHSVREEEMAALRDDVLVFVQSVRERRPAWIRLESRFGPEAEEVRVDTPAGRVRLRGAIDRVDELEGGGLRIVDYKTGRASGYRRTRPFDGGRRVQHLLYTLAARQLFGARVETMEYHFPTRRGEDRIVAFGAAELAAGEQVLEALFGLATDGWFVTTEDPADCRYCDFSAVCRAEVNDYGGVSCERVGWAKETGSTLPEYERLNTLRGIDG